MDIVYVRMLESTVMIDGIPLLQVLKGGSVVGVSTLCESNIDYLVYILHFLNTSI